LVHHPLSSPDDAVHDPLQRPRARFLHLASRGEESLKRFEGKAVLITGAGRGIGRALALGFAREGAALLLCSRTPAELEAVAVEAGALGVKVKAERCDVSDAAQAAAFVAAGVKELGRIDVLINNAGILGPIAPLAEVSDADWAAVLGANLSSAFYVTREVLRASMLPRRRGCVINVSSGQGRKASAGWGAYAASKFGLEGLTQAWAQEVREQGIRLYSLNPTATRTTMRAAAMPDEDPATLKAPEKAVPAFLELASDDCRIPAGQALWLDRQTGKLQA
jgi:NAD(P)-dependent dehydrogenase (short-subunit alcohol dehydrogenase family)